MNSETTVFLVEDDERLRSSLEWLLRSHGYWVIASASLSAALATYDPTAPGCLVLDVQLPEGTGLELLEKFRERGGTHPFIIMTAYGRITMAVEAMRLGAVDFLEKPFDNTQLLERVQEAVAKDIKNRQLDDETRDLSKKIQILSPREWEIAKLVAAGQSSKEIAHTLGIKTKTAQVHRHNMLTKLGSISSTEVAALVTKAQSLAEQGRLKLPH